MKYLITDLNIQLNGHKFGFINNLLLYIESLNTDDQYFFLTNNSEEFELKSDRKNIQILKLSNEEQTHISAQKRYLLKCWEEWKIIKSFANNQNIDRVILMEFDPYQLGIAFTRFRFEVSGIWFRPYHRMMPENDGIKAKIHFIKHILQKKVTFLPALLNHSLKKVFVLNDEEVRSFFNFFSDKIHYLPDPIFIYPKAEGFDLRKKYQIPAKNLILLQFGNMDERKNNENIIKALELIPAEVANKVTFLVIGKFAEGYREQQVLKLKSEKATYQLITHNQFVTDQEMEATFAQSDVIMRMNVNFYGSSGVVGSAALHNKPVIVSNHGVMNDQVIKYYLGKTLAPDDVEGIKDTIMSYFENPEERKVDGKKYLESHSAEAYARMLLDF